MVTAWPAWADTTVDWAAFDAVLIRSTWDYHEVPEQFLDWVRRVSAITHLHNPAPLVEWNAHKRYLTDLRARGLAVVPSVVVERDAPESVSAIADREGWEEVVVKPAVSAGGKATGRYHRDDPAADRALDAVLATSDALVQPYLREIESEGETSVVVIDGEVTHAVGKRPEVGEFRVQVQFGGHERPIEPTEAERSLARAAVAVVTALGVPTYARVDCVTVDGRPLLMELEVIEPSLYLPYGPDDAADRLVAAVRRSIDGSAEPHPV